MRPTPRSLIVSNILSALTLLTVDNLEMIFLLGRRNQYRADEIFPAFACIELFVYVLKKLLNFLLSPDILTLIVGHDVEALTKCLFNAEFMIFYLCHDAPGINFDQLFTYSP